MAHAYPTPFADAAPYFASLGLSVFPLIGGSKRPLVGTHGVLDATDNTEQIKILTKRLSRCNIAVATGPVTIIDVDLRSGGFETLSKLEADGRKLPDCPVSKTGNNGRHFWFGTPSALPSRTAIFPGIDVKSRGGYVVAPPSILGPSSAGSGGSYEWIIRPDNVGFPAPPDWLIDHLRPAPVAALPRQRINVQAGTDAIRRQALHDLDTAASEYAHLTDGRRVKLFTLACRVGKYVANGILTDAELRSAFYDAARANGALAKHGPSWAAVAIRNALNAAANDPLPPVARVFRVGAHV